MNTNANEFEAFVLLTNVLKSEKYKKLNLKAEDPTKLKLKIGEQEIDFFDIVVELIKCYEEVNLESRVNDYLVKKLEKTVLSLFENTLGDYQERLKQNYIKIVREALEKKGYFKENEALLDEFFKMI